MRKLPANDYTIQVVKIDILSGRKEIGNYDYFSSHIYIYEPVSVKTGLNDIKMKIQKTALRESINFSECFLKI